MYLGHNKNKMKQFRLSQARLALLAIIALVVLAGCVLLSIPNAEPVLTDTPTSSEPTSGPICPPSVFLPDAAEIFLRTDSRIAMIKMSDPTVGQPADQISLSHGEIVLNSLLPVEKWVEVLSPSGFIARLTGRIMLVSYEGASGQFTVACVDGACKIGPDAQRLVDLTANSQASLDKDGNFLGPVAISLNNLPASCETIFQTYKPPTETPTFTPAPTLAADTGATATAACQEFHNQYPLTPTCP